jgi:hypothetical protein
MGMEDYSRHQQSIIKRYYKNADSIALTRAQELVTELYLAEGKKRTKVWETLVKNLEKIGVPATQIEHLRKTDNPELVLKTLESKL